MVDLPCHGAHSGRVFDHCVSAVHKIRRQTGGFRLCVYKLGITSSLSGRWPSYKESGFTSMTCLHTSMNLSSIEMLEAGLIAVFSMEPNGSLRNINKGGEGMRRKDGTPRFPPPYFMYVVAARADQRRLIGS